MNAMSIETYIQSKKGKVLRFIKNVAYKMKT